jgi:hypothetical protein
MEVILWVTKMKMTKRVSVLLLVFFLTPVLLNICPAEGFVLAKTEPNSSSYEGEPHPNQGAGHDVVSCSYSLHHCNLVTHDKTSWFFGLDSHALNSFENLFPSLEIVKSLYHPPRIQP